jgi:quercetin dioxygenase-like cupin family protein
MKPIHLDDIKPVTLCTGFDSKLLHSNSMTWSFVNSKAGHTLPAHQHVHEQVTHIVKGDFELTVDGVPHLLRAGDLFIIPSNTVHSGKSITDCDIIDVFNPVREDYAKLSS